jgi:outer membrane receptor protein involved in Fe transport
VQNGVPVALPNANVDVSEIREEAFAAAVWRPDSVFTLDAAARWESSTISESGDTRKSEHFLFAKPRVLATWNLDQDDQLRLHVEREVGQLDFNNFAASANLAGGIISAGNANLQPPRDWLSEASIEHHFWKKGSVVVDVARRDFTDLIDEIAVQGFTAPGNIGSGYREEANVKLSLPLEWLGITDGLFT